MLVAPTLAAQTKLPKANPEFLSEDGTRAVVSPVAAAEGVASHESRINIYTQHGDKVCSLDFSSEDGEHGQTVAKAAWTADGNLFVFSLDNSGGHPPRSHPTLFVSFKKYAPGSNPQVCLLDSDLDNPGITTSDFQLSAPNSVTTRIYEASTDATVSLSEITSQVPLKGKSRCVPCEGAKTVRFWP